MVGVVLLLFWMLGGFLGAGVGGEYFDGIVDTGDGEEGFVGVAWQ